MATTNRMKSIHFAGGEVAAAALLALSFGLVGGSADAEMRATVLGTGALTHGNQAQFQQRHGIPVDASGGIEDLFYESEVGDASFRLRGRGIIDNHDYELDLRLDQPDKGYVAGGYREFRTWYDGTGGFFPGNGAFFDIFDDDLSLDRGEAWLEGGLRLPSLPQITLRYRHLFRDGRKNSVVWGDTALTGTGTRKIVPAFWDIDEERDIFEGEVEHRGDGLVVGGALLYESSDLNNSRNMSRNPTEAGVERFLTQRDEVDTDVFNARGYVERHSENDGAVVTTAFSYTRVKNDIGGSSRIYGSTYDATFSPTSPNRQPFDEGFIDLTGRTELQQRTGAVNLAIAPHEDWRLLAGFKAQNDSTTANSDFTETNVGFPPLLTTSETPLLGMSDTNTTTLTGTLELRYTGCKKWVWYTRGEWEDVDGDILEREIDPAGPTIDLERMTDIGAFRQKYVLGANYYPLSRLNLGGRVYYRDHDTSFDHVLDSTLNTGGNRYPAYILSQKIETYGGDARATWRVLDTFSLVARYDGRQSTIDTEFDDGLGNIESGRIETHTIGTSANWNPTSAVYVQANASYTDNRTETPAADAVTDVVQNFDNDFWTASLASGVALDERTDVQAQYFYYRADNYKDNSAVGQPFGSDAEEHGVTVAVGRKLDEHTRASLRYGYFNNDEILAGGNNNYEAHVVQGRLEVSF